MNWIKPLSELTLNEIEQVGSKAAHLGAMQRAGFNIPSGFVITVDAFSEHFGQITDPLVKPPPPRLSGELMSAVIDALTVHLGDEREVAVRSSSTEEDLSFASYAGQHSTYYFVPPTHLDQAIVDCWMSLWSNAALAYRRSGAAAVESGLPLRMAVIVQKMIPADRSGIVFSKDPIANTDDIVIEACWGLGAALMDGHVSPDFARLDEEGGLLEYQVRDKQAQVLSSPNNTNAQRLQALPKDLRGAPVLADNEAEKIANLALQLETLFEAPQDVEWSYHGDTLYLLQSRPITTRQVPYPGHEQLVLFKPVAENFSEPMSPLSEDLFAAALPKVGVMFGGHLYINLATIRRFMPFQIDDAELANLLLLRPSSKPLKLDAVSTLRTVAYASLLLILDGANWIRANYMNLADLSRYADVTAKLASNSALTLKQLMQRLVWARHTFTPAYHQLFALNISAARYFVLIGLLNKLVKRFAPSYPSAELSLIYHGRNEMQSVQMLEGLSSLVELLHADAELIDAIKSGLTTLPIGHPFTVAFDAFLATHGHRGAREIDLAAPRWREQPSSLLNLLVDTPTSSRDKNAAHGTFLAARDKLNSHLKPWQRKVINYLAVQISHFIALREDTRHLHVYAFDRMRQRILEIEQTLLHDNVLAVEGDIFYLTADEIELLCASKLQPSEAHTRIRARRRERKIHSHQITPETFNIDRLGEPLPTDASTVLVHGICASPGVVEGIARIVLNPSYASHLLPGEILIAPYSDPAWTPLFVRAAGAVIANGSFLSHAGTVARELQLPCLVDIPDCTTRFNDGQRLRLDASAGTVEVL